MAGRIRRHLLLRHGIPFTLVEPVVGSPSAALAHAPLTAPEDVPQPDLEPGRSTTCTASSSASPGETDGLEDETPRCNPATPSPSSESARARTTATCADATRTRPSYAELWDAVAGFAAGLTGPRARAASASPSTSTSGSRRSTSIFGTSAAGGVFVPVNPLLEAAAGRLHPRRLRRARARHDAPSASSCCARARRLPGGRARRRGRRTTPRRTAPPTCPYARGTRCLRTSLCSHRAGRSRPRHGGDPLHLGQHRQAEGRRATRTATCSSAARASASTSATRPDDVILAALPLSFDAGFSQLTTAFTVGAHVVLVNYLLPRDVVRLCAEHSVTGLTCVPPLWIQLAEQDWPEEATRSLRYFANTGGRMPKRRSTGCARSSRGASRT